MRVTTNTPIAIATHNDCVRACVLSSRAMVTKPMPFNIAASGNKVASAAGAKRRTARWATT